MANEYYLRIPDLDDWISDPKYTKWIPLLTLSFGHSGGSPSGTGGTGGTGTGMGRPAFNEMGVTKKLDSASAALREMYTRDRSAGEAAIFMSGLPAGSAYAILLMRKVQVDSLRYASAGNEESLEMVHFSFAEYQSMPLAQYLALRGAAALVGLYNWFH